MLSVEYLRRVTNRINLGTEFHYGASSVTRTPGLAYKDEPESVTNRLFALTPNVRLDYIVGAQCRLYIKADAGIGLRTNPMEGTQFQFEYQLFPLGIEINAKHLSLFGELGAGTLYYVRFGAGRWF